MFTRDRHRQIAGRKQNKSRRRALGCEVLEQRRLLATVTLNTDTGVSGELRTEMMAASPGATIDFDLSAGFETINLDPALGQLLVNKQLIVDGSNSAGSGVPVTVVGGGGFPMVPNRVFYIDDSSPTISVSVTLQNLTVTGGLARYGGGIRNHELLTLDNVTVTGNLADALVPGTVHEGGGIFNANELTVQNSLISGNAVQNASGANDGGGIFNYGGSVTLDNSTVEANTADRNGGGIVNTGYLDVIGSVVKANTAGGNGGGVWNCANVAVTDGSTIEDNQAGKPDQDNAGGGIYSTSWCGGSINPGTGAGFGLLLEHSRVTGNRVINDATGARTFPRGGGVYGVGHGFIRMDYATISGNVASGSSGVLYSAFGRGGGVYISAAGGTSTTPRTLFGDISHTTFEDNFANFQGGAIGVRGRDSSQADVTTDNAIVTGNTAFGSGGAFLVGSPGESSRTGLASLTIENSTVSGNSAGAGGGAAENSFGGALTVRDSTFSYNDAAGSGGAIRNAGISLMAAELPPTLTIEKSTLHDNSAVAGGGAIQNRNSHLFIDNSTLSGNTAGDRGGGLQLFSVPGTAIAYRSQIDFTTITLNTASIGGGIDINPFHELQLNNTIVSGNTDSGSGPEIYDAGAALTLYYNFIGENTGTTLTPALPDANGNWVGNSTAPIDAMLGPLYDNGGPTLTHMPSSSSGVIDMGEPSSAETMDQRDADRPADGDGDGMAVVDIGAVEFGSTVPAGDCDFDRDGNCDINDIDALIMEIVTGTHNPLYDLTGEGDVDLADRDRWLEDAGALNLPSGNAYLLGDATLDGIVDGQDFLDWNANKFTNTAKWSQGDWNADGITDGQDFLLWNGNKFQSSAFQALPVQSLITSPPAFRRLDAVFANLDHRESTRDSPETDLFDQAIVINPWVL